MNQSPRQTLMTTCAALGVGVWSCSAFAAHIDNFTVGDESLLISEGGATTASTTTTDASSMPLGGNTRFTQIAFAPAMEDGASFSAQIDSAEGELAFANTADAWAEFTVRYGDNGTLDTVSNPVGPDYNALEVSFSAIEFDPTDTPQINGGIPTLTVTATDTGSNSQNVSIQLADDSAQADYLFAHADFVGVDFSSLDTLTFRIDSNVVGADFTLDQITRVVIPEPTTGLLVTGVGLLVLSRRRRS